MFQTPILFLIFNRPEETRQVFEQIKKIHPAKLYIAADGPRNEKNGEQELCDKSRSIINLIDWDCEVKTLFHDENLGCGKAVSSAIDWFFENVESGIILEDDCFPDLSFFSFCETLLEYYKENPNIMHVGGTNSQFGKKSDFASYYFSKYPHIWGWATWRRAWNKFKFSFTAEDAIRLEDIFNQYDFSVEERVYWKQHWNTSIDTWDIQWTFSCWLNNGVTIVPNINLISNIGFNTNATHTKTDSILANIPAKKMGNINHPTTIVINKKADDYTFRKFNLMEQHLSIKIRNWIFNKIPDAINKKIKKII